MNAYLMHLKLDLHAQYPLRNKQKKSDVMNFYHIQRALVFGILIRDTLLFFSFLSFSQVDFASAWDLNLNLNGWIGLYHGYESKAFVWNELLILFAFSCVCFNSIHVLYLYIRMFYF